ncbi:MAG: FMN-binding protein [Firmicutes bacterium]|nr:FMN-binding protein [Dethiobacter sp.]MBS3889034.1 FMN-binding protein [Bacillota bacterium]MBS4053750.1 FMN-binding protein [Thermaerobacter sp.]
MREIIKLSLILAIICSVAGAALAATYSVTSNIIAERQQAELNMRLQELLPLADTFTPVVADGVTYYLATRAGQPAGAVMVAAGRGYAGPIDLLVSFAADGKVQGVKVTGHSETAGIGNRVETPSFLRQFVGKEQGQPVAIGQDIVAATGATVSARGVAAGVRQAIADFNVHVLRAPPTIEEFDLSRVRDGVYKGEAPGFYGPVTVEVTVLGSKITQVTVSHVDTPEVADEAAEIIPRRIVDKQHFRVDVVSGATATSEAIMLAVRNAVPEPVLEISELADGEYEGEGEGLMGPIRVRVTVQGGRVVNIGVLAHSETPDYAARAFPVITAAVMEKQALQVDVVSGATAASEGLLTALKTALEKAPLR